MIQRGAIYDIDWPGAGRHPVVVITRDTAIEVLQNITVVLITTTLRGLLTEVKLGPNEGLKHECAANCDNVVTIPKKSLLLHRGQLGSLKLAELNKALMIALGLS